MVENKTLPLVSLILPIRNEFAYIKRALVAVLDQDYPPERVEILVADGMSTDGTRGIVREIIARHPARYIHLIDNPERSVPTALNRALRRARGEVVVRVDGHCRIAPDYLRQCVHHLSQGDLDGVGGPIETVGETYLARAIALAMSTPFGVGGSSFRTAHDRAKLVDTVAFPAYTRAAIRKAGLFDKELVRNQDDEYNYRLRKLGGRILLSPKIRARYYSRGTLSSLLSQYFQYGFWKVRVLQKHPRQMRPRQFTPPLFVSALIAFSANALFHPLGRLLLAFLAGTYLLVDLAASLWTAARRGWRFLPLLFIIYPSLHLSYGLGFLVGLVRFARRWGDKEGVVPEIQVNGEPS